jgi:hypothetical protein
MKVSDKSPGQITIFGFLRGIVAQDDEIPLGDGTTHFESAMSCLHRLACLWAERENAGRLVQEIHSLEQLSASITDGNPTRQEFGLTLLCIALTNTVSHEARAFLEYLFSIF